MFVQKKISLQGLETGCQLVTSQILQPLARELRNITHGVLHLFIDQPLASLSINENADSTVQSDLTQALYHMVPENKQGDTSADFLRAALTGRSISLPISNGRLQTGTWQGIYCITWAAQQEHPIIATIQTGQVASSTTIRSSRGCIDITREIRSKVNFQHGMLHVLVKHTSASFVFAQAKQAEPLENFFNTIVPEAWNDEFFVHTYEGPDDMPGHVKSSLIGVSCCLPVTDGKLNLDSSLSLYLGEHRYGRNSRRISITPLASCSEMHTSSAPFTAHLPPSQSSTNPNLPTSTYIALEDLYASLPDVAELKVGVFHLTVQSTGVSIVLLPDSEDSKQIGVALLRRLQAFSIANTNLALTTPLMSGNRLSLPVTQGRINFNTPHKICVYVQPQANGTPIPTQIKLQLTLQGN